MTFRVPTSTQYITFPVDLETSSLITWSENGRTKSASYYLTKCYWGNLRTARTREHVQFLVSSQGINQPGPTQSQFNRPAVIRDKPFRNSKMSLDFELEILGEASLHIAAEFVEERYRGGPMKCYHIHDLSRMVNSSSGQVQQAAEHEPGADEDAAHRWITMQLNSAFHYGQGKTNGEMERWIVYHPTIAPGLQPPRIYQHRFTGISFESLFKALSTSATSVTPDSMKMAAETGAKAAEVLFNTGKNLRGDYLHRFLGPDAIREATSLHRELLKLTPSFLNLPVREKELVAIQCAEAKDLREDLTDAECVQMLTHKALIGYIHAIEKTTWGPLVNWLSARISSKVKDGAEADQRLGPLLKASKPAVAGSNSLKATVEEVNQALENAVVFLENSPEGPPKKVRLTNDPSVVQMEEQLSQSTGKELPTKEGEHQTREKEATKNVQNAVQSQNVSTRPQRQHRINLLYRNVRQVNGKPK